MTILNNGVGFQLCHLKLTIEENKMLTSQKFSEIMWSHTIM